MVHYCCVPLCKNRHTKAGISMHSFPKDPGISRVWQQMIRRDEKKCAKISRCSKVCSAHFHSTDFLTNPFMKRRCLKPQAVPSIFAWTVDVKERRRLNRPAVPVPKLRDSATGDMMGCDETLPVTTSKEVHFRKIATSSNSCEAPCSDTVTRPTNLSSGEGPHAKLLTLLEQNTVKLEPFHKPSVNRDEYDGTMAQSELLDVPIDIKDEPFDQVIVEDEPFIETIPNNGPFETSISEGPFNETVENIELIVKNTVKEEAITIDNNEPLTETILTEEPFGETVACSVTKQQFDVSMINKESYEPFKETIIKPDVQHTETVTVPCELLLLNEPNTDLLVSEDTVPATVTSQQPVLINNTNEFVRIVNIEEIFRKKVPSMKPESQIPKATNAGSMISVGIMQRKETATSLNFDVATNVNNVANLTNPKTPTHILAVSTNNSETTHISSDHDNSNLNDFSSNMFPMKPTDNSELFYNHLCKFHFKLDHNRTLRSTIVIPRLLQILKPCPKNFRGKFKCSLCTMIFDALHLVDIHLFDVHHRFNEIHVDCKVCLSHPDKNLKWYFDHLPQHTQYYNHYVEAGTKWQCTQCEILSSYGEENSFLFKNLTVEKSLREKSLYFQYNIECSLPCDPHKSNSFVCVVCTNTFETQEKLDQHLEIHVDYVFRKCPLCEQKCDNMNDYYSHIDEIHGRIKTIDVDFRYKNCNSVKCPQMQGDNKRFIYDPSKPVDYNRLECPFCLVGFFEPKLFYAHCIPYSPLLPTIVRECPKCQLHFSSDSASQAHLQKVHRGVYGYWCRICYKPNHSMQNHDSHVFNKHNAQIIHCILCKSNILNKYQSVVHLKMCYLKSSMVDTDVVCPICGFICEDLDYLLNHVRVELHELSHQYQCKYCLNFFYGKFNLVAHMLHGKCIHCELYFCNDKSLRDHRGMCKEKQSI